MRRGVHTRTRTHHHHKPAYPFAQTTTFSAQFQSTNGMTNMMQHALERMDSRCKTECSKQLHTVAFLSHAMPLLQRWWQFSMLCKVKWIA
mmetsp:Transcript_53478/g.88051  ORF Transcript_53478/g.88051 Transcript_53478/m.88051 type:complete len:90 (+) Transcript_53478:504-773(+)